MKRNGLGKILERKMEKVGQLSKDNGVIAVYLFGSQITGKTAPQSDIDLAVLFDQTIPKGRREKLKVHLLTEFIEIFGSDQVDIVCLNDAPPFLAYEEIIRSGKLIFSADDNQRSEYEIEVFHRYVDTEHLRRIQRQYLIEEIKGKAKFLESRKVIP